jgi:hypothetical protein
MRHLLAVWRRLNLLDGDATEEAERSLANVVGKDLPQLAQSYWLTRTRSASKRVPSCPWDMIHLLVS